jgi:hypothetical protein
VPRFVENWRAAWKSRFFRVQLLESLIGLLLALVLMRLFLSYVEQRSGISLPDPFLGLFAPVDLTTITFSTLYSGMLLGLVSLALDPHAFLLAVRAVVALAILRIIFLFLLPLDPPPGCIPLSDPFIRMRVIFPVVSRDLFFAWPTALLVLFGFCSRWRDIKYIFFGAALLLSVFFLLQHAHYTLDVAGAPVFAYVAFGVARANTLRNGSARTEKKPPGKL